MPGMNEIFVARQPIFDIRQNVYGYEIFYRSSETNSFDNTRHDIATASTLMNAFVAFGLDNLTNNKPAFINFHESFIIEEIPELFPTDNLVIEMPALLEPTPAILARFKALHEKGYVIALGDFAIKPGFEPFLDYARIVKLDFKKLGIDDVRNVIIRCKLKPHLIFLAEKVETHEEFECARKIGCSLYQGYYFGRPIMHRTQTLQSLEVTYISLLNAVSKNEIDFSEVSKIILRDMSLTYYLLKLVNAPAFGLLSRVTSVRQALVVLGEREIQKWFSMIVLNIIGKEKPGELIRVSLLRARLAELLAAKTPMRTKSEHFFLAGLFSMLDAIMDRPFMQIVHEIYLPEAVKNYLLGTEGMITPVMSLVIAYERGDWDRVVDLAQSLQLGTDEIINAYKEALKWQHDMKLD